MSSPERNQARANRAQKALDAYFAAAGEIADCDDYANIVDLVTDLFHLAHQKEIEAEYITSGAMGNLQAELDLSDRSDD